MVTRSDATPNVRKSLLLKGFRRPKRSWLPEGKERRKLRCFQDKAAKIVQDYKVERYIRFEVKESRTTAKNIWSGVVLILTVHIK
jgi:hypothetical protein